MEKRELKKLMVSCIESENELYDFCMECIEHIFKDEAQTVKNEFNTYYDALDEGYGLSLSCMLNNSEKRVRERQERINKQVKESLKGAA